MTRKTLSTGLPDFCASDQGSCSFLSPQDLIEKWHVKSMILTVARIRMQEIESGSGQKGLVSVLYFFTQDGRLFPKGFLLSEKGELEALKESTGASTLGDLIGRQVRLQVRSRKGHSIIRISSRPVVLKKGPAGFQGN